MTRETFDAARARLLVQEISEHLSALPEKGAKYGELRAEVDALKALLEADAAQPVVKESLRNLGGIVGRVEAELRADGLRAGIFAGDIGRMLGLD